MKQKILLQSLLFAAAAAFGLTTAARAGDPPPPSGTMGLLGQTYAGLSYSYLDLDHAPNANSYGFQYNESLNTGLDGVLTYDWSQSGLNGAGWRQKQQAIGGALRAFSSSLTWGRPYVEAGLGYEWTRFAGTHDNSVVWEVAVGAELQVAPAFTVTPFVQYRDTPDLGRESTWTGGAKANYWMTSQWALTAGLARNDHHDTMYTAGTNFRF